METSLSSFGHPWTYVDILIAVEVEEEEKLKNLLMWGKFSFHVMEDHQIFTGVKNKKYLILIVNKKFKFVNGTVWSNSLIFLIR